MKNILEKVKSDERLKNVPEKIGQLNREFKKVANQNKFQNIISFFNTIREKVNNYIHEMKIPVIDRYIISEFWIPFLSGASIITGVWLSADHIRKVFRLVTISNASIMTIISIIGLSLPQILVTTIPIGVLWGAFMVFTRLSNDSEIIAMRTSGISIMRIFKPVMIFGALAGLLSFGINEIIVPVTNPLVRKIEVYTIYKTPFERKKSNFTYLEKSNDDLKRIFYSKTYNADKDLLKQLTILDFTNSKLTQIYSASSAKWSPYRGGWILFNGTNHFISPEDGVSRVSSFDKFFIPSGKTPREMLKEVNPPRELNFFKLGRLLHLQKNTMLQTGDYLQALVEFHRKFSSPIACILIALVGAALGILPRRSSTSFNYIILAVIIFQFYVTQSILGSMAEAGKMLPFLAAWMPNVVLLFISSILIYRRSRMA